MYNPTDAMISDEIKHNKSNTGYRSNDQLIQSTDNIFINNTFSGNIADYAGGAIRCNFPLAAIYIINSIFWGNEANDGNDIHYSGADTIIIAYSDINPADSNIFGNWTGGYGNMFQDPGFIDDTCHIDNTSPCIDAGIDSLEIDGTWYYAPDFDFEGSPRPFGGGIDIGADEWDGDGYEDQIIQNSKFNIQNYPNPFSDHTTIEFTLPEECKVSLQIFDLTGREIETLVSGHLEKGDHTYTLQAVNLQSGIYLYRLSARNEVMTGKLVVRNVK
jgi:hypothetical protein